MWTRIFLGFGVLLLMISGCWSPSNDATIKPETLAERYFRGVYGCDPSVVDELAAADIVISYPIFQTIFGQPVLRGRKAVKRLVENFCRTWADPQLTVHDAITQGNTVVFLWNFQARNIGMLPGGQQPTNRVHDWGGITFFRFDSEGKIVAEIGEESEPGPVDRVRKGGADF